MTQAGTAPTLGGPATSLTLDLRHGARWCSLRRGGREWLWSRPDARRSSAQPGCRFVDAGGFEECVPTVRGRPDHGDVWSRPWAGDASRHRVASAEFDLERRLRVEGDAVTATYRLSARPGFRFVWAGHLLLDLSEDAALDAPAATPVRVFGPDESWAGRPWPDRDGTRLDRLGPDDGTAVSAIVATGDVVVRDGDDRCRVKVDCAGQPVSVGLWRNLGGWPDHGPYRSIGVEPMLGRVWDRESAVEETDTAVVGDEGRVEWSMTLLWE